GTDAMLHTKPFPQAFEIPIRDYCLAVDEVVYAGQPVAAVVAETRYIAEDAASLILVEYEVLAQVLDARDAVEIPGATSHNSLNDSRIFHKTLAYGKVDEAFDGADFVMSESFVFESYSAMPLETYAVLAEYNRATGMLVIHDNCQIPLYTASSVSNALSIPPNRIRFIEQDIGGGFGIKTMTPIYDILISLLSIKTGLPVKWIETRSEHMMASAHGTRRQYDAKVAVMKSGEIRGIKVRAFEDVGAFVRRPGQTALVSCLRAFSGPYRFRAFEYDMNMVLTNKCPAGPSRGNGKNHHAFLLERLIERVAGELKLDPVQVRLRNFIQPEEFPYLTVNGCLYDSGNYPDALSRVAKIIGYQAFRVEQARSRKEGRNLGIGFALTLDPAASNMSQDGFFHNEVQKWGTSETASVHMDSSGNATVALSSVPQGQGHETIATGLVSDILGIPPENVTVFTGFDSSRNIGTPTSGTYSSRFAPISANAIVLAAEEIKKKLLRVASKILHVGMEDLTIDQGRIKSVANRASFISVREVANLVYSGTPDKISQSERSLDSTVTYSYPFGRNEDEAKTNLASTYAYQAHAAAVEVDVETGIVKILCYAIVDDSGRSLNKMIVEGQVQGGACNGIAAALYEKFEYDGEGQLLTSTFNDYLAPTAMEIPDLKTELIENKSPFTPTGAKGVGESGALGPQPAIMNAIEDALRSYGVKVQESHVTPEKILNLFLKSWKGLNI
ncbi:MAG: xanthine dehydrogenase family protein molybdopterin-binding subunit, partial [Nitrososphaerales archaeon]